MRSVINVSLSVSVRIVVKIVKKVNIMMSCLIRCTAFPIGSTSRYRYKAEYRRCVAKRDDEQGLDGGNLVWRV